MLIQHTHLIDFPMIQKRPGFISCLSLTNPRLAISSQNSCMHRQPVISYPVTRAPARLPLSVGAVLVLLWAASRQRQIKITSNSGKSMGFDVKNSIPAECRSYWTRCKGKVSQDVLFVLKVSGEPALFIFQFFQCDIRHKAGTDPQCIFIDLKCRRME
jgi:hypothetical protein